MPLIKNLAKLIVPYGTGLPILGLWCGLLTLSPAATAQASVVAPPKYRVILDAKMDADLELSIAMMGCKKQSDGSNKFEVIRDNEGRSADESLHNAKIFLVQNRQNPASLGSKLVRTFPSLKKLVHYFRGSDNLPSSSLFVSKTVPLTGTIFSKVALRELIDPAYPFVTIFLSLESRNLTSRIYTTELNLNTRREDPWRLDGDEAQFPMVCKGTFPSTPAEEFARAFYPYQELEPIP